MFATLKENNIVLVSASLHNNLFLGLEFVYDRNLFIGNLRNLCKVNFLKGVISN